MAEVYGEGEYPSPEFLGDKSPRNSCLSRKGRGRYMLIGGVGPRFGFFGVEGGPFGIGIGVVGDGFNRAVGNADAAVNADVGIDNYLRVAQAESIHRANADAGFAENAGIVYYRGHFYAP